VFAHLHLAMAAAVCPPPGAALPALHWPLLSALLWLAGSGGIAWAARLLDDPRPSQQRALRWLMVLALGCTMAALAFDLESHRSAGLDPGDQAWSATVGMLLGYQAFHAGVLLFAGGFVLARSWCGKLQPVARASLDNTQLLWHCATAQGVLGALVVQAAPRLIG